MFLITGATGFVGRSLVPYLTEVGVNILPVNKVQLNSFNFNIINDKLIANSLNGIIHLAGKAHEFNNDISINEYYEVNTELTKKVFSEFASSKASVFIYISSVKACADSVVDTLTEETIPNPITHYGKSKLLAEEFILNTKVSAGKRIYILRPCMIHGPNNKGNLNLLYKFVKKGYPWFLGLFENKRSFCSIDNLNFVIKELIFNDNIPSGIYNIADDKPISTNELIALISNSLNKKFKIWFVPIYLIKSIAKLGDIIKLPLNSDRLNKLTESYVVSNNKIKNYLNKDLPFSSVEGINKTLDSFNKKN